MKKLFAIFVLLCGAWPGRGQQAAYTLEIDSLTVTAQRRLADVGLTKTDLDSVLLRESVVNSLGDLLSRNTSVFIKSYGRGTLATASFRGTAPSHTQVLWNGLKLNSPMLGMTDFSLIPAYFTDEVSLLHGAGSVRMTGGGLGGAVVLGTRTERLTGWETQFIQGVSSFGTYDEFFRLGYGKGGFRSSTRVSYVTSDNDYEYVNYNKKNFDKDRWVYPTERNKNGSYRDLHLLQELAYEGRGGDRFSLSAWLTDSRRGIPMLNVNYREEDDSRNRQDETTLRVAGGWSRYGDRLKLDAKAGYSYSDMLYTYAGETGTGSLTEMIRSASRVHTGTLRFAADWFPSDKWMVRASLTSEWHKVSSRERYEKTGYEKNRAEASAFVSVRWRPFSRLGIAADLREDFYGSRFAPPVPAAFLDYVLWKKAGLVLKASATRNYRYPTLNDLYFLPGGNPDLKGEQGRTYDGGVEFDLKGKRISFGGEVSAYDSRIDDWIVWLPTFKGFWEPNNVKQVHAYGVELRGTLTARLGKWELYLNANWSRTRSVNHGDPVNWADESIGKQLVYIPEYASGVTGKISWRGFAFTYNYNYYSERFTTSSNEKDTKVGRLSAYYMNDVSLEKSFPARLWNLSLKFSVYNLFDEEYVSVLSRPMPGRNYGIFIGIRPRWK